MTLRKEIEKAAFDYINSDAVKAENMQLAFGDFINGAEWMQKKMIDKACEWITEHIDIPYEGGYIDDSPVASDYIEWCEKRLEYAKEVADAFKQAMEE